jgi:hypothetical protein
MNDETMIVDLGIDVPEWVDQDITIYDVKSIYQGGCASGAYMPAVTYYQAVETMGTHGDDILEYIENETGELPMPNSDESWSGIAVFYLSYAVELWISSIMMEIESIIKNEDEE